VFLFQPQGGEHAYTLRYERAKLYRKVWVEAATKVAVRYGISDIALRKRVGATSFCL